jgi:predicted nucleic acid-binding Zn ribbon protein
VILIVVSLYVLHETFEENPISDYFATPMLQKALLVGVCLVVAGVVVRMLEKGTKVVARNRCIVCRTTIPHGAIYCRAHLRSVLHDEDEKTHMTRIRRK